MRMILFKIRDAVLTEVEDVGDAGGIAFDVIQKEAVVTREVQTFQAALE